MASSPNTSRIAPTGALRALAMTFTGDAIVIIGSGIIEMVGDAATARRSCRRWLAAEHRH